MAKSGAHRLIVADITQSKLRGKALIDALGQMNTSPTKDSETLAKKAKKSNKK